MTLSIISLSLAALSSAEEAFFTLGSVLPVIMQAGQSVSAPLHKPAVNGPVENPAIRELVDANGEEDSEAESYQDGRTKGVDRETRSRAFAWCRSFLSGAWKTITQEDFEISIVRYDNQKSSLL